MREGGKEHLVIWEQFFQVGILKIVTFNVVQHCFPVADSLPFMGISLLAQMLSIET